MFSYYYPYFKNEGNGDSEKLGIQNQTAGKYGDSSSILSLLLFFPISKATLSLVYL